MTTALPTYIQDRLFSIPVLHPHIPHIYTDTLNVLLIIVYLPSTLCQFIYLVCMCVFVETSFAIAFTCQVVGV